MGDQNIGKPDVLETIGERIARLRAEQNWTQQTLADRLAISRVAVSHIETNLSTPSERTITLAAGSFKISPHKLIAGTTYPQGKADKLPRIVCFYTQLDLELLLLENDLAWLERLANLPDKQTASFQAYQDWSLRLERLSLEYIDEVDRERIAFAQHQLRILYSP